MKRFSAEKHEKLLRLLEQIDSANDMVFDEIFTRIRSAIDGEQSRVAS